MFLVLLIVFSLFSFLVIFSYDFLNHTTILIHVILSWLKRTLRSFLPVLIILYLIIYFCLLSYFMLIKDFRYFVLGSFVFRVSGLGLISYRRSHDGKDIQSVKSTWSVLNSEITARTLRTLEGMIKGTKQTQKSHKVRSILNNILAEKFPNICHWICLSVFLVRTRLNTSYSQKN